MSREKSEENTDDISSLNVLQTYFRLYGGWPALFCSIYPYLALGITIICSSLWLAEDKGVRIWLSLSLSTIPSLMAFSIGGMAIFLAFSNDRLLKVIQQDGQADSLYMKTAAVFFHFILIQTSALILSIITRALSYDVISAIGFYLMTYGALVAIPIAGNLLKLAQIFNAKA